ncbi:hypothetical protein [Allokutzneria sp. NRRL B-24872]|uniref:hypothetical protein n=1 Tax=Allokutzneria sp. NRRL B-24872 TaxID=1137961 RepID=UPI000A3B3E19|nr:hypothetical protein [Allokutzneria sp. NRRL B-24872]
MRVSLIVGAVLAAFAVTTVAEAAPAACSVVAQYNGTNIYNKSNMPVGTLAKGNSRSSECSTKRYNNRSVVFLSGGGSYVEAAYVKITHGA